jgi:hypothetical protein
MQKMKTLRESILSDNYDMECPPQDFPNAKNLLKALKGLPKPFWIKDNKFHGDESTVYFFKSPEQFSAFNSFLYDDNQSLKDNNQHCKMYHTKNSTGGPVIRIFYYDADSRMHYCTIDRTAMGLYISVGWTTSSTLKSKYDSRVLPKAMMNISENVPKTIAWYLNSLR